MANHLQLELVTRKTRGGVKERERERAQSRSKHLIKGKIRWVVKILPDEMKTNICHLLPN